MQPARTQLAVIKQSLLVLIPIMMGVAPFGLITGMNYTDAGYSVYDAMLSSIFIFAGSSQIAMLHLLTKDTPTLIIVLTVGIINFRHLLYSASISYYWRALPRKTRFFQAFFLTDQAYALSLLEYQKNIPVRERIWYYSSFAISMYLGWIFFTILGAILGAYIPNSWGIDLVLPLVFLTVMLPMIKNIHRVVSGLFGALAMLVFYDLPHHSGLLVAILIGIAVGVLSEFISSERKLKKSS